MARNSYDQQRGVCRLKWEEGAPSPSDGRPVIVEVWRPELALGWAQDNKPRISVHAAIEFRCTVDGAWMVMKNGGLTPITDKGAQIRRHAYPTYRHWHDTVTLDGWLPK